MRFYIRTSKRTGISTGPAGMAGLGIGWLFLIGLPIAIVLWSFDHWYTVPIGILAVVFAVLVLIGRLTR